MDLLECIAELEEMKDGLFAPESMQEVINSLKEISKNFELNGWGK